MVIILSYVESYAFILGCLYSACASGVDSSCISGILLNNGLTFDFSTVGGRYWRKVIAFLAYLC